MRHAGQNWLVAAAALMVLPAVAATTLDDIRVHSIQPEVFAWRFTSVMASGEQPVLAFNHLSGETRFARVGETVGEYRLVSYRPRTSERFVKDLNATVAETSGTAVLEQGDGARYELELGRPLPQPGNVACLVSLANGGWLYAGDGDALSLGNEPVRIRLHPNTDVTAATGAGTRLIPPLTETEQERIQSLWSERARTREAAERRAREAAIERAEQEKVDRMLADIEPAPRPAPPRPQRRERMFIGTEFRYPLEYDVLPIAVRTKSGKLSIQPIAVPTRFGAYRRGVGVRVR